jgi:hypothetical protein
MISCAAIAGVGVGEMDTRPMSTTGREPGNAWLMSTPMIKGELQSLLAQLVPAKKWPKSTRLKDLSEFTVATFAPDSNDVSERRALELAQVLRTNERH